MQDRCSVTAMFSAHNNHPSACPYLHSGSRCFGPSSDTITFNSSINLATSSTIQPNVYDIARNSKLRADAVEFVPRSYMGRGATQCIKRHWQIVERRRNRAKNKEHRSNGGRESLTGTTDDWIIGDKCWISGTKSGKVAFLGETKFAQGDWAGVVLDEATGKNDGSVSGVRYFQCPSNRGIFCRVNKLSREPVGNSVVDQVAGVLSEHCNSADEDQSSSEIVSPSSIAVAPSNIVVGRKRNRKKKKLKETKEQRIICPAHIRGRCRRGDKCTFIHGKICDLCNQAVIHPTDQEQNARHIEECLNNHVTEIEDACAVGKRPQNQCGICLEIVEEKLNIDGQKFGILPNCKHCFCFECMTKWRQTRSYESNNKRACPICTIISDYVIPSSTWVEDDTEKRALIRTYLHGTSWFAANFSVFRSLLFDKQMCCIYLLILINCFVVWLLLWFICRNFRSY